MTLCKKSYAERFRKPETPELSNHFAEYVLQVTILLELSRKKSLTEEEIVSTMKTKFDPRLDSLIIKDSLDNLWFNQMIQTESRYGKCHFYLTDKGRRTLTARRKREKTQ